MTRKNCLYVYRPITPLAMLPILRVRTLCTMLILIMLTMLMLIWSVVTPIVITRPCLIGLQSDRHVDIMYQ
jgi:hypothetical protein